MAVIHDNADIDTGPFLQFVTDFLALCIGVFWKKQRMVRIVVIIDIGLINIGLINIGQINAGIGHYETQAMRDDDDVLADTQDLG